MDFKFIGITRDPTNQAILSDKKDIMDSGESTPVMLLPVPENPFDPNAIIFSCDYMTGT